MKGVSETDPNKKVECTRVQQAGQKLSDGKGIEDAADEGAQDPLQWEGSKSLNIDDNTLDGDLELKNDGADHLESGILSLDATYLRIRYC